MSALAGHVRFPATPLRSLEAFRRFREEGRDLLDERYRRERELGSREATIATAGLCGPCLRVTTFSSLTAGGEVLADGRRVPNWREEQLCGCHLRLGARQRALLHLALPHLRGDWHRFGVLGGSDPLVRLLREHGPVQAWERLEATGDGLLLPGAHPGLLHALISPDHIHCVPDDKAALSACAHALAPGAPFAFTVPFHAGEEATRSEADVAWRGGRRQALLARAAHHFGWDLLERVREAGFADCAAYCHWSEELGYLGPFNMTFLAFR